MAGVLTSYTAILAVNWSTGGRKTITSHWEIWCRMPCLSRPWNESIVDHIRLRIWYNPGKEKQKRNLDKKTATRTASKGACRKRYGIIRISETSKGADAWLEKNLLHNRLLCYICVDWHALRRIRPLYNVHEGSSPILPACPSKNHKTL